MRRFRIIQQRWQLEICRVASGLSANQTVRVDTQRPPALRAPFLRADGSSGVMFSFLEDMGRVLEHCPSGQTGGARAPTQHRHEIRNPLSAISHAPGNCSPRSGASCWDRLLRIVNDNTQRLRRIVRTLLELGRRRYTSGRLSRPKAFLSSFLRRVLQQRTWTRWSSTAPARTVRRCASIARTCVGAGTSPNALRHSRHRGQGSVVVELVSADAAHFELHIATMGGVPYPLRRTGL